MDPPASSDTSRTEPLRISAVISSLQPGGAERVMSLLLNGLASRGHRVTLVTFDDGSEPPFYPLAGDVALAPLATARRRAGIGDAVRHNLTRLARLRGALRRQRPDVVLSFMSTTNIVTQLAALHLAVPVVVCERSHPGYDPLGRGWSVARRLTYPWAARLVVQTRAAREWFPSAIAARASILPNPVAAAPPAGASATRARRVVGMGTLKPLKRFSLLLRAFAKTQATQPDWRLQLIGDGPEGPRLQALARELGVAEVVQWVGRVADPQPYLMGAELFALTSEYEGFPNALLEAMACGLAPVSFDCPAGPGEIIRHGVDGLLIPNGDVEALAAALARLMGDGALRRSLQQQAARIGERFGLERVLDRWEALLIEVAGEGAQARHG